MAVRWRQGLKGIARDVGRLSVRIENQISTRTSIQEALVGVKWKTHARVAREESPTGLRGRTDFARKSAVTMVHPAEGAGW